MWIVTLEEAWFNKNPWMTHLIVHGYSLCFNSRLEEDKIKEFLCFNSRLEKDKIKSLIQDFFVVFHTLSTCQLLPRSSSSIASSSLPPLRSLHRPYLLPFSFYAGRTPPSCPREPTWAWATCTPRGSTETIQLIQLVGQEQLLGRNVSSCRPPPSCPREPMWAWAACTTRGSTETIQLPASFNWWDKNNCWGHNVSSRANPEPGCEAGMLQQPRRSEL